MEEPDTWVAKVLLLGWEGSASRTYASELEGLSHLGVQVHDNVLTLHSVGKSSCSFTSTHRYSIESVERGSLVDALQATFQSSNRIELIGTGLNIGAAYDADRQTISIFDHCSDQSDSSAQVEHIFVSAQVHILRNPFVGTVRKIACGDNHCQFLGSYQCFSYGSNQYGELGIGQRTAYETSLQRISLPEDTKILDIAAGPNYSAVVTLPHGHVYTFGNGAYYKLGHGDDEDRLAPTRVVELEVGSFNMDGTTAGVHLIACGTWHTIVVAKGTNDVYGWGWNKFGNLGANPKQYSTSGVYTSTNNSMVYDAGNDSHGGLYGFTHGNVQARAGAQHCTAGRGTVLVRTVEHQEEMVTLPRRIEELDAEHLLGEYCPDTMHANRAKHDTGDSHGTAMDNTVSKVTCGSRHSALLTAAGRVIVIGQLGPTLIPNLDPIAIHNHIMQSFHAPPTTVDANVSGGHKAGAGSCLSGTGSAVGCKRPFSDTENGVYAQQSHTNSSGNCRRTEKGTKICVPKITQIYQWNNADYHARVLNDSDVFPTADTKVLDIGFLGCKFPISQSEVRLQLPNTKDPGLSTSNSQTTCTTKTNLIQILSTMNINIQFPEITVQVTANEKDSVKDLKTKMSFFSEENELLAFNGCLLSDEHELHSLGIADGSVISVIARNNKPINCRQALLQSVALVPKSGPSGGFLHYIGQALPSIFNSGGMILAASILSAGMIIAANILTERDRWLPSKDELKIMAEDFTPGSLSDLTDNNFEGAKTLFSDLIKHAHISAHNCLKYISN